MKRLIISLAIALFGFAPAVLVSVPAYADSKDEVCQGIGLAGGNCSDNSGETGISKLVSAVVNILSIIVGIAAVIMIIIGGLKYVTSGGDSGSITSAKHTIIYALVGLVIVALAQFLVHYVVKSTT
jgi:hypothetical protein